MRSVPSDEVPQKRASGAVHTLKTLCRHKRNRKCRERRHPKHPNISPKIAIPSDLMRDSLSDAPDSASQDHHHCSGIILGKGTKRVNLGTTWNHLKPLGFKDNSLCCLMFNLLSLMISWCLRAGCLRGVRQRRQPCLQHRRGECRHPTNDVIFWCVSNQTLSNSDFFWSTALWVAVLVQTS